MSAPARPNPIPDSYRRVTPCLVVQGAAKALEFYAAVFGAWTVASHVEDVTPDQLAQRMAELSG